MFELKWFKKITGDVAHTRYQPLRGNDTSESRKPGPELIKLFHAQLI